MLPGSSASKLQPVPFPRFSLKCDSNDVTNSIGLFASSTFQHSNLVSSSELLSKSSFVLLPLQAIHFGCASRPTLCCFPPFVPLCSTNLSVSFLERRANQHPARERSTPLGSFFFAPNWIRAEDLLPGWALLYLDRPRLTSSSAAQQTLCYHPASTHSYKLYSFLGSEESPASSSFGILSARKQQSIFGPIQDQPIAEGATFLYWIFLIGEFCFSSPPPRVLCLFPAAFLLLWLDHNHTLITIICV